MPSVVAAGVLALAIVWWALSGRGEPTAVNGGAALENETVEAPRPPIGRFPLQSGAENPRRPTGQSPAGGIASPTTPAREPLAPAGDLPVGNVSPSTPTDADVADAGKRPTPASPAPLPPADPAVGAAEVAIIQQVIDAFAQAHRDRSSATLKMLQPSLTAGELAVLDRTFAESDDTISESSSRRRRSKAIGLGFAGRLCVGSASTVRRLEK